MKDSSGRKSLAGRGCRKTGFTLIEMAISILIIGLLAAPAIQAYNNYTITQKRITTTQNVTAVLTAIQTYRQANGVFPCPAGLNLPHTDVNYGVAVDCTSTSLLATNPAPGGCTQGVCIEQSTRAAFPQPLPPPLDLYQKRVIVGAVPFRLLQIDEKQTYDGYGSRIVYAMTESMSDIKTLSSANGAISMQNQPGAAPPAKALINPPDSAVFVLLSPGPDRVGGFTRDGKVTNSCTGAIGLDVQNCNPGFEGGAARLNPLFVSTSENSAVGANHFDDQMNYFESQADPLWSIVPNTNPPNIQDLTNKNVGVDLTAGAVPAVTLDIGSGLGNTDSLLVYGATANGNAGQIQVSKVIDATTPAASFAPAMIGGANGIQCPPGQYMVAVDGTQPGKAQCTATPAVHCPGPGDAANATVLNGFKANGKPICTTIPNPPCVATNFTVCSANDVSLPQMLDTQKSSVIGPLNVATNGCRSVQYTCSAGTWNKTKDTNPAFCSFTAVVTHPACSCVTQMGAGWTGTCTATKTTTCPSGSNTTYNTTGCLCGGAQALPNQSQNCPSPPWLSNGAQETRTVNTDASCNLNYGTWDTHLCTCGLSNIQYLNCADYGAFNSGNQAFQTRTVDAATCTAGGWGAVNTSGCTCISQPDQIGVSDGSCPAPWSGTQKHDQHWNPATCSYGSWGADYGCSCDTTTHFPCSGTQDCSLAAGYGPDCYTPNNPSGYYTNVYTAPNSCVAGTCNITAPGSCAQINFQLKDPSVAGTNTLGLSSPNPGDPCFCGDHRKTEASQPVICYEKTDLAHVYSCSCQ